jgi:hypothetical protein
MTTRSTTSLVGLCPTRCSVVTHPELLFRLRFAVPVFPAPVVSIPSRFHRDPFSKFPKVVAPFHPRRPPPSPVAPFLLYFPKSCSFPRCLFDSLITSSCLAAKLRLPRSLSNLIRTRFLFSVWRPCRFSRDLNADNGHSKPPPSSSGSLSHIPCSCRCFFVVVFLT